MEIQGSLHGDQGMKKLDQVLNIIYQCDSQFKDALDELSFFFKQYLDDGRLPFDTEKEYPSDVQRKIFEWMNVRYNNLISFLNERCCSFSKENENGLHSLFLADISRPLAPAIAKIYIENEYFKDDILIQSDPSFQDAVYQQLLNNFASSQSFEVLLHPFNNPQKLWSFTQLFLKISSNLDSNDSLELLTVFDGVLNRLDDPLAAFDFLYEQLEISPKHAAMALPHLVSVSLERAIDVPTFYDLAFKSITRESLSLSGRKRFLETYVHVLTSKSLPKNIAIAFAIKFSRLLPILPLDSQQDILGIIQILIRAHKGVLELLNFIDTPPSEIECIEKVQPQTLWEAKAMEFSSVPLISDIGQKLGQLRLPEDFESFNLYDAIEAIKAPPPGTSKVGNWLFGLDKSIWDI